VGLGQLLVPVSGQPDPGQWALLGQHKVGIKHGSIYGPHTPQTLTLLLCKIFKSFKPKHLREIFIFYFKNKIRSGVRQGTPHMDSHCEMQKIQIDVSVMTSLEFIFQNTLLKVLK